MDRFSAMQAFVHVVDAGSFVRAAERMQLSTTSLSRLIADLEGRLHVRLLNRTTRRLSLTEAGQAFHERCVDLLAELEEAEVLASASSQVARGTIRLTCPTNLAAQPIGEAIAQFLVRHGEVRFDVVVADRQIDLVDEGFDVAVRIGAVGSDRLVARKLGSTELVPCASSGYLRRHGMPRDPADLSRHEVITYAYSPSPRAWRFVDARGQSREVRVQSRVHSNSGALAVAAAAGGAGIVFEPDFVVQPALDAGLLQPVLPGWRGPPLDVWAVYPSRRHLAAKVRLFVAHLAEVFAERPLGIGSTPEKASRRRSR